VEVERRLAATQGSWGPPRYGRRAGFSFLRHPVFLDNPTCPPEAATAAWRHKETFEGDLIAGAEAMGYKLGFAGWPPVREPWSSHSEFLTLHQLELAAG